MMIGVGRQSDGDGIEQHGEAAVVAKIESNHTGRPLPRLVGAPWGIVERPISSRTRPGRFPCRLIHRPNRRRSRC